MSGLGRDDGLFGERGSNWLVGGPDRDHLDGGGAFGGEAKGDTYKSVEALTGGRFGDVPTGDSKANMLEGLEATYKLYGRGENDMLIGYKGADRLFGGTGSDFASFAYSDRGLRLNLADSSRCTGEARSDPYNSIEYFIGTRNDDRMQGDDGDDLLDGGPGAERLDGGRGHDIATHRDISARIVVDLQKTRNSTGEAKGDSYSSVKGVEGWSFDDVLRGRDGPDDLRGLAGDDLLRGRGGDDMLNGGRAAFPT